MPPLLRTLILPLLGGSFLLCVGCQSYTKSDGGLSDQDLPDQWTAIGVSSKSVTGWLGDFDNNGVLKRLVDEAIGNNFNLQSAATRITQARARARIAGADLLPQISGSINGIRSQRLRGSAFEKITANQFSTSMDVSWQIDLWGRLSNLRNSALAQLDASHADYQAARLSLAANVASSALNLVESQQQIAVSQQTVESLRINLAILDAKLEAGDVDDRTALEITLSRADVLRAEANLTANQRISDATRRVMETLLGRYPKGLIEGLTNFPTVDREVPAGLPSHLLLRRPDLIAAEHRIRAATQQTEASWKALLPDVSINAGGGTSTTDKFSDLLDPKALVWDIAGRLTQTIFQGGRLAANVTLSKAQREELSTAYAESALQAFREVETALAAEGYYRQQQLKLEGAVRESNLAEKLALGQYEKGLVEIITVLESQRRAFDARSSLLRIHNERLQNRIDLYLALGGDFDHGPDLAENS